MPDGNAGKLAGTSSDSNVTGGFNTYGRQLDPEDINRLMFMIENTKDKAELKELYQQYLDDKNRLIQERTAKPIAASGPSEPNYRPSRQVLELPERLKPTAAQRNEIAPNLQQYQPDVFDMLISERTGVPIANPEPLPSPQPTIRAIPTVRAIASPAPASPQPTFTLADLSR